MSMRCDGTLTSLGFDRRMCLRGRLSKFASVGSFEYDRCSLASCDVGLCPCNLESPSLVGDGRASAMWLPDPDLSSSLQEREMCFGLGPASSPCAFLFLLPRPVVGCESTMSLYVCGCADAEKSCWLYGGLLPNKPEVM